jgi:hypothetical protein
LMVIIYFSIKMFFLMLWSIWKSPLHHYITLNEVGICSTYGWVLLHVTVLNIPLLVERFTTNFPWPY